MQALPPDPHALRPVDSHDAADTFEEYEDLKTVLLAGGDRFDTRVACETAVKGRAFAVYTASIGSRDPLAPAIGFFAGIHGLERIGSQLIIHYMRTLLYRLQWDELLHRQLQTVRLVFMPIVNPGGMWAGRRSNPQGVDLMRNAPQQAEDHVPFLAGGQRWGPWLPWYCGRRGAPMERESATLLRVVQEELSSRPFSLALDCHSGYGFGDSIWFPYAKTRRLMQHLPEMYALKTMLAQSHPHHPYSFEPQSNQYLLHGDLWDHAYDKAPASSLFLPMTLEMGSWIWIRKNPRQLFSRSGIFNPIKAHRIQRVLRRHADLLDFLTRAAYGARRWLPHAGQREQLARLATAHWHRSMLRPGLEADPTV
ncbi:M14 family zinc carboxypeptidase [Polaromonas sp.]|uniref:M14 family zinc carboxypeptidase n=1 Tax=Polaromonas sp. TaxID=1869339 RepID=UPI002FC7C40F